MTFLKNVLMTKNSWFRGFLFYALPVSLKLLDLILTIYLLRFPWNHESNPIALWIIQRGALFSCVVFISLSLLVGAILDRMYKRLLDPQVKKNIKILCGVAIFYNYFILTAPVVNNALIAGHM